MISAKSIQHEYDKLYVQLRKYIWSFSIVQTIADIEIASYTLFTDIDDLRRLLNKLKMETLSVYNKDEEYRSALDSFLNLIAETGTIYLKLNQVKEVLSYED